MNNQPVIFMIAAPLAGAVAALFGKLFKAFDRPGRILSLVTLAGTLAALFLTAGEVFSGAVLQYALGGWPEPYGIALVLDGFAWITVALIAVVSILVGISVLGDDHYGPGFFLYYMFLITGMTGVALTGDLFTMFVSFEIVAIAAYVLIAYEQTDAGLAASFKYLILSSVGILFFLFGTFLIYRDLGTLSISDISRILRESGNLRAAPAVHLALASLCVGIGVRTAFIPFHTWLPEAHAYAPHPVSALLSGVLIKVSFFAMVRLVLRFSGAYLFDLFLWIGGFTALLAVISALAQSDAKRLLAYHSVSQMGYILAVFGAGSQLALTAAFMHAVSHALFKSLLFLTVGAAVELNGERNLYRMIPSGRALPVFAAAFFVGSASIAGMPPFNGFASKAFITLGMKYSPAYPLIWITSFLTIASFIKLSRIYLPGPVFQRPDEQRPAGIFPGRRPGTPAAVSVVILGVLCVAGGVFGSRLGAQFFVLLEGGTPPLIPNFYSSGKLLGILLLIAVGSAAYFLLQTGKGKKLARSVRSFNPGLNTVLTFFFIGLLGFALAAF